jgi:hypothetical protein
VPYYIMVRDPDTGLWEPTEHVPWRDRARALESWDDLRRLTSRRYWVVWIEDDEDERGEQWLNCWRSG